MSSRGRSLSQAKSATARDRNKSLSMSLSISTKMPSQYSKTLLESTYDPEKEKNIVSYLQTYIEQLVMENCQLRDQIDKRDCQVSLLRESILAKDEEVAEMRSSKKAIGESVRLIEHHNSLYMRQLQDRNGEIAELRYQLGNIREPRKAKPVFYLPLRSMSKDRRVASNTETSLSGRLTDKGGLRKRQGYGPS